MTKPGTVNYLILSSQAEFDALNALINQHLGYPTADRLTLTYALSPTVNNSNPLQLALEIQDRCLPLLTAQQSATLVTGDFLKQNGWASTTTPISIKVNPIKPPGPPDPIDPPKPPPKGE